MGAATPSGKANHMADAYRIEQAEKPAWSVIGPAIDVHNQQQAGDDHARPLCFLMHDAADEVVGGAIGVTYWDWLHVNLMWVEEALRGQGYGSRLLAALEDAARGQGATKAFLDTFSFQAPEFYQRHGYEVFGELREFPPGHRRYFMEKTL